MNPKFYELVLRVTNHPEIMADPRLFSASQGLLGALKAYQKYPTEINQKNALDRLDYLQEQLTLKILGQVA